MLLGLLLCNTVGADLLQDKTRAGLDEFSSRELCG